MAKKTPESHSAPLSSSISDDDTASSSSSEGEPSTTPKKPPVEPITATKPRSKPNHKPSNPTPIPPKRPPPTTTTTNPLNKKPKTTTATAGEDEAKKSSTTLFQRLWSEDDEIVILEGILEYKAKKGADPMADSNGFHDFIKNSLHLNFDRRQMVSKLRRLKKRFENSIGKKPTSNPHDRAVLALSDKIWGNDVITPKKIDKKPHNKAKIKEEGSPSPSSWKFIGKASVAMGLDENVVKLGLELSDEIKKGEIEDKWKELHMEESKIFSRKLELARQENKLIVEALKSGGK